MGAVIPVLYFALTAVQFFAIIAGLESWVGLHWLIAVPLSLVVATIPLIGTIVGVMGAVVGWEWLWWQAALLFFGPFLAMVALASVLGWWER